MMTANSNSAAFLESHGQSLAAEGRNREAAEAFAAAVARGGDTPGLHFNLGLTALRSDYTATASRALKRLLELQPDHVDGLINLAAAEKMREQPEQAEPLLRRALALAPDHPAAHHNLAILLRNRRDHAAAATHVDRALAARPDFADAMATKASILAETHDLPAAIAWYRKAIAADPSRAKAHSALSVVLHEVRDIEGAFAANARAIALDAEAPEPHFNRAMFLFAQGRLAEGWLEYDWRWRTPGVPARWRNFPQPLWRGGPIESGRKLLVWAEQGVGDEILYASMLPDLVARHAAVVFECDPRLAGLFARSFPAIEVVPRSDPADARTLDPAIAAQTPAAELGRVFRPDLASFPARRRFLGADAGMIARMRATLGATSGKIVGVSWFSENHSVARQKSTYLADWAPVLRQRGVTFVNLQYGDVASDLASVREIADVKQVRGVDPRQDLDRLAALIACCDLVITVCNTTAHLAGALGVPVWVLVARDRGRLWWTFIERADSPWYPSARLFRQTQEEDWRPAITAVAAALPQPLDRP